jgi:hypothetical protein
VRQCAARRGWAWPGLAWLGGAWLGKAGQGKAGQGKARQGKARQGKARQGKARQGKARQGKARQGKARQGKVLMIKDFKVAVSHTINLGNYESMRVEAEVTVDAEGLEWEEARQDAQEGLKTLLADTFKSQCRPEWFSQIASKRRAQ